MASPQPQVSGNHDPSLAAQCLEFIQSLVNQKIGFNFHLTSGQFSCSFDSNGTVTPASARIPTEVKKKSSSPSTKRRNARRRQQFLENKKLGSLSVDCEKPPQSACEEPPQPAHNEPPQPSAPEEPIWTISESPSFPSSKSSDLDTNDFGGGHITKKMRMEKIPALKVLIDTESSPKYRIQQLDGNCSLSDLSPCENDQSEHGDDPNMDQSISCPNCDQTLTSTSHQCQDPDQIESDQITQELINTLSFNPFMGPHNERCEMERKRWKDECRKEIRCARKKLSKDHFKKLLSAKLCFCYEHPMTDFYGIDKHYKP